MKPSRSAPILALDDSEDDISMLRRLLARAGNAHPFCPFLSAEAFMLWLPTQFRPERTIPRPMLLFLDIKMPRVTGFEVLRWLRRTRACNSLPVVMLSSSDDPRDVRHAARLGADCFVAKFPTPATMNDIIDDAARLWDGEVATGFQKTYNLLGPRGQSTLG